MWRPRVFYSWWLHPHAENHHFNWVPRSHTVWSFPKLHCQIHSTRFDLRSLIYIARSHAARSHTASSFPDLRCQIHSTQFIAWSTLPDSRTSQDAESVSTIDASFMKPWLHLKPWCSQHPTADFDLDCDSITFLHVELQRLGHHCSMARSPSTAARNCVYVSIYSG